MIFAHLLFALIVGLLIGYFVGERTGRTIFAVPVSAMDTKFMEMQEMIQKKIVQAMGIPPEHLGLKKRD